MTGNFWLFIVLGICLLAALFVVYNYIKIKRMPEGTDRMVKMSGIIREGANVFIEKEFNKPYFKELSKFLHDAYETKTIYPKKSQVFSAFQFY